jgi:hypothetical protein
VAVAVVAVVEVVAVASAVVPVVEASAVAVASVPSNQNDSRNQRFVSFCKNNSDFACRYAIKVIPLQAKSD